jgi:hypothetical protein
MRPLILFLLALAPTPALAAAQPLPSSAVAEAPIVAEARTFMDRYAEDLRRGERGAVAERYDRQGAWHVSPGAASFESWAQIETRYLRRWQPPASFEWQDLSFEAAGPDAVVVAGRFLWWPLKAATRDPLVFGYSALLVRRGGKLRIRLEHESAAAAAPPR